MLGAAIASCLHHRGHTASDESSTQSLGHAAPLWAPFSRPGCARHV